MTIYGPNRYKKYVFYDGKSVARSPLSNKTSTFDERGPKSDKNHRVLPSEKKVTLATLERNDHLRSRSEQKACVLRWKTCCTFAPLEQNIHFRPHQPQKSSFCTRGTNVFFWTFAPLEQNITFWPEVGPIQQNSRFTREVGRFFAQPSKTPNITDESLQKGVQKGSEWSPRNSDQTYFGPWRINITPVIIEENWLLADFKKKKSRAWTPKNDKLCESGP